MFEKEAEEIANKKLCSERICYNHCNFNSPKHHRCGEWHRIYECAKESAEFGYNKANEWHYPSKDEYPKECENVLCYCKVVNVEFYSIGHTIIGGDNKIRWWSSNRSEELNVYAWRYVPEPPELPKEIKRKE